MSKLIQCRTNPEADPYHTADVQPTYTLLKIYGDGDYALEQECDDNATPVREANGLVLTFDLEIRPDQAAARTYLESPEAVALVERIHAGHGKEWDGHNLVGTLTDDARTAITELLAGLNGLPENQMSLWDAGDWLGHLNDGEIGINALTTGAEITALAEKLEADALNEKVILSGTEEYLFERRRLIRANLAGADLRSVNLVGASLSGADLSSCDLRGVNLTGADLSRTNLTEARFSGANLSGANLTDADLSGADLTDANLTGANLTKARFSGANLTGATVTGTLSE
ncbi:MAG TPA: pentapeptide repeat-containing protein [Anaerolineaceae bacterium]|nr:pentapeptide repeat-containing protein [Anaerolineaceae bacterium]HPN50005.1 pentapeptide repeat-containing protein [Anaerolineaceae bacterium]